MEKFKSAMIVLLLAASLALVVALVESWSGRYNDGYKDGLGIGQNQRC